MRHQRAQEEAGSSEVQRRLVQGSILPQRFLEMDGRGLQRRGQPHAEPVHGDTGIHLAGHDFHVKSPQERRLSLRVSEHRLRSPGELASPRRSAHLDQDLADDPVPQARERLRRAVADGGLDQPSGGIEVHECGVGATGLEEPQTRIRVQHGCRTELFPRPRGRIVPGIQGCVDEGLDLGLHERARALHGRAAPMAVIIDELPVRRGGAARRRQFAPGADGNEDSEAQQRAFRQQYSDLPLVLEETDKLAKHHRGRAPHLMTEQIEVGKLHRNAFTHACSLPDA